MMVFELYRLFDITQDEMRAFFQAKYPGVRPEDFD
jgi:hypothetical protein